MFDLIDLIKNNEEILIKDILQYAKLGSYTQYNSPLEEVWQISIKGFTDSISTILTENSLQRKSCFELNIESLLGFSLREAELHRRRGVTLDMFIGCLKCYRYGYMDLISKSQILDGHKYEYKDILAKIFDRIEIAICSSWNIENSNKIIGDLQSGNRFMVNEKNKYLTIYESIPLPILILNENNFIENINLSAIVLFSIPGQPDIDYHGKNLADTKLFWLINKIEEFVTDERKQIKFETEISTRKGLRHFEVKLNRMKDISGKFKETVVIFNDISESKRIQELSTFYLKLFDQLPSLIWIADKKFESVYSNKSLLDFTGKTIQTESSKGWIDLAHPDDRNRLLKMLKKTIRDKDSFNWVGRFRRADGDYRWLNTHGRPYNDIDVNFAGYLCVSYDITENIEMLEKLRQSEEQYRKLVESSQDGILIVDGDEIVLANKAAAKFLAVIKPENLFGKQIYEFINAEYHLSARERILKAMQGQNNTFIEEKFKRVDGSIFDVEVSSSPFIYRDQKLVQVCFHDISQRKRIEEEALNKTKLESLGLLAGGLAHDFNNILTIILGNISLAKIFGTNDVKIYEMLNEMEKASMEARSLTQQLLTFAKGGTPVKKIVFLRKQIQETVSLALRGSNVRCECRLTPDLWAAEVDIGQINQVLNNLVINAKQAMVNGGTIYVTAENVTGIKGLKEKHSNQEQNSYLKITIEDTGIGIPKSIINKVFDPYFTTKEKGNGLGLSTAYSIITKHNGFLMVNSKEGKGTIFAVYLPAIPDKIPVQEEEYELSQGYGRILLMDDEPKIREIAGEILLHLGYRVDFAVNGEQAIELYSLALQKNNPYDSVIMDLTIPGGMGGKETMEILLQLDPDVKAIVSSGYSDDPVMAKYNKYGFKGRVAKPYLIEELSKTLQEVIIDHSSKVS